MIELPGEKTLMGNEMAETAAADGWVKHPTGENYDDLSGKRQRILLESSGLLEAKYHE